MRTCLYRSSTLFLGVMGAAGLVLALSPPAGAATFGLIDNPVDWSLFCDSDPLVCGDPYNYQGAPLRDYEAQFGFSDPSSNATPSPLDSDISSGFDGTNATTCNPDLAGNPTSCGPEASAFFTYCANCGGSGRDYIFLRMRVNGDPRQKSGFTSSHWNFLHDVDNDGVKEYWMDVNGSHTSDIDRVRLLYDNGSTNQIPNDSPASGGGSCPGGVEGGTLINEFVACHDSSLAGCETSFTRAVEIGDGTGEWYIDLQLPIDAFTLGDGCGVSDPAAWMAGTFNTEVDAAQGLRYLFSTSRSNTDPLQKDLTAPGFGDLAPVTLAHVQVRREGDGTTLEWTTLTETGNVGFHVYALVDGRKVRLTDAMIPSPVGDSLQPQHYRFQVPDSVDARRFFIEDVDVEARPKLHGPFAPGREWGTKVAPETVDWSAVRRQLDRRSGEPALSARTGAAGKGGPGAVPEFELFVDETRLYRVTYEDLVAADPAFAGYSHASRLALTSSGEAVPIRVVVPAGAKGSAAFGPGSYLEFHGEALDSLYTRANVYRLGVDPSRASRFAAGGAASDVGTDPTVYREESVFEEDRLYTFGPPDGAEPWYWSRLLAIAGRPPVVRSYSMAVDEVAVATGATLTVDLWGITDWPGKVADHHVEIAVNGTLVADEHFDGFTRNRVTVPLPEGLLQDGSNVLTLTMPGDTGNAFDLVNLDRFEARFSRRAVAADGGLTLDAAGGPVTVTGLPAGEAVAYRLGSSPAYLPVSSAGGAATVDPGSSPARVTVAAVSSLAAPRIAPARTAEGIEAGSAQYLVITHSLFEESVEPLVAARRAQGYGVQVVDVEDLYVAYTHGVVDPEAIRAHIRYAAKRLGTEMVLLVGGDSYDYLDNLGLGSVSFVPTLYTRTHRLVSHNPVDPLYTDLDGDRIPDLPIGRLPARTVGELEHMIAKTLAFESSDNWGTAIFTADVKSPHYDFAKESRELSETYLSRWQVEEAYIDDLGAQGAHDALMDALDRGVSLAHFFGHSAPGLWTYNGLLSASQARGLQNRDLTLVLQWGCWNTYFVDPISDSMGDAFLRAAGGAAATMGASAITDLPPDRALAEELLQRLVEPGKPVGVALTEAKQALGRTHPHYEDVLLGWTLLGDPALVLTR